MTVVARRFSARPERTSIETWSAITELICKTNKEAKTDFQKIGGVAAALIAEETFRNDPLVMTGSGPRLRIYCLYDEDALTGDDRNEDPLNWNPTEGDWKVFLPCSSEDFNWVTNSLKAKNAKFVAYDVEKGIAEETQTTSESKQFIIDVEAFKEL